MRKGKLTIFRSMEILNSIIIYLSSQKVYIPMYLYMSACIHICDTHGIQGKSRELLGLGI